MPNLSSMKAWLTPRRNAEADTSLWSIPIQHPRDAQQAHRSTAPLLRQIVPAIYLPEPTARQMLSIAQILHAGNPSSPNVTWQIMSGDILDQFLAPLKAANGASQTRKTLIAMRPSCISLLSQ